MIVYPEMANELREVLEDKKVILFAGGMGAGKDTSYESLVSFIGLLGIDDLEEYHFSYAHPLKDETNRIIQDIKDNISKEDFLDKYNLHDVEYSYEGAKDILKDLNENDNAYSRTPAIRKFLQYWGSEVRRVQKDSYWVDIAKDEIQKHTNNGEIVFITDGRFNNEFNLIHELGGVNICLSCDEKSRVNRIINRDGIKPSQDALNHVSERDYKTYDKFDIIIDNTNQTESDSLNELVEKLLALKEK